MSNNDTDELVDDHRVYYRVKKKCFPITVLVCILLLVGCIVLAVLYSQSAVNKKTSPRVVQKPRKKYEICNEDRCFELGKAIVHSLNQSVNPCDDFYAYACGGWQKKNPVEKLSKLPALTVMTKLQIKNFRILIQAIAQVSRNHSKNVAVMKTVRFFKSCINTPAIVSTGAKPLMNLVAEYSGWSVFNNSDPGVSIETRIARAARDLNVNALIGTTVEPNYYNSSNRIIYLYEAPLAFKDRSLYLNKSHEVRIKVKDKIQAIAKLFGMNGIEAKLMEIFNFEVKLAQITTGKTPKQELLEAIKKSVLENAFIPDNRTKLKDFCSQSGFQCEFIRKILTSIYGQSISGDETIIVPNIDYFKKLHVLYKATIAAGNAHVIHDYVMWKMVNKYKEAIMLPGNKTVTPAARFGSCILTMVNASDMTFGLMYVNANFDDKSKKTVEEITNNLRQSFIERLPQQTWMDPETQKKAKEKAEAIRVIIGYPPYIKDSRKLEERYKSFNVTDDFFANFRAMHRFLRMREINTYGKPVDKNAWIDGFSPVLVNGFYNPMANAITYFAGIIQPPCYNSEYPRYMQYGALGMVIGHELTHGFDLTGRMFYKDGNLRDWWSPSADANFKEKAQCLVDQYDKYTFHGMKIDGTLTINENIADNGGIKIAYDAYQRWVAKNGTYQKILPGLNLTPDQLFFVGFAQEWCGVFTKKGASAQLKDVHSPGKYRVIGSLSNNEKFSEVFQCPIGSPMNPKNKCSVW